MITIPDELWFLTAYLAVGLLLMEGCRWTRVRWKIEPLRPGPMLLIFFLWPAVILFAIKLRCGGSKGS